MSALGNRRGIVNVMRPLLVLVTLCAVAAAQPSPDVERLTQTAHSLARDHQCAALDAVAVRVRAADADYYAHVFTPDPVLAVCLGVHPPAGADAGGVARTDRRSPEVA